MTALTTHCIILCAGENQRWGGYRNAPRKHLVDIEGEPLLSRTLRQVAAYRPERTVVVVREPDVGLYMPFCRPGNEIYPLRSQPGLHTEAWKYLSSRAMWNTAGRTISLLGDVWFSDEAMQTIFQSPEEGWLAFGRSGPSRLTGCQWGELFAHRFHSSKEHLEKLMVLDGLYRAGKCKRAASGWAHYHLMMGLDPHIQRVGPRFVEIDDFTEDFDYPHDYDRWMAGRRT